MKERKLRLKMSQEKKDAQREKERLSKNAKRCTKTQEECAKCKKIMQECVRRQPQSETNEKGAQRKKTDHGFTIIFAEDFRQLKPVGHRH